MAGLEDMVRSSAPGGNIGKPLMIALGALLASGVLFRGGGAGQPAAAGSQPTSNEGAGGLSTHAAAPTIALATMAVTTTGMARLRSKRGCATAVLVPVGVASAAPPAAISFN